MNDASNPRRVFAPEFDPLISARFLRTERRAPDAQRKGGIIVYYSVIYGKTEFSRKEFGSFREALRFYNERKNPIKCIKEHSTAGVKTIIRHAADSFDYFTVTDIYSVPCATRNGEKAIRVCGDWAYVQMADGMLTYHRAGNEWHLHDKQVCTNF